MKNAVLFVVMLLALFDSGCTKKSSELGTVENPIKFHFVPSVDSQLIESNSKVFKQYLENNTPYKFEVIIPQSFTAVVEAFGTEKADVAVLNTFGYIKAHEKYQAEARLTVIRNGHANYQSQFIARSDSKIKKLEDLQGKKIAFVDSSSMSGYLLPLKTLNDKKIKPRETMFGQKHDNVVAMVYQGVVDAGATFYSPPFKDEKGVSQIEDARRLVKTQYPDVEQKVSIIYLSESIPNDPVTFRKGIPEKIKLKLINAMIDFIATPEGKKAFSAIYGVTDLKLAKDADYELVRMMFKELGQDPSDLMKK